MTSADAEYSFDRCRHPATGPGPFRFVSHTPGVGVELERFDDDREGPAYL